MSADGEKLTSKLLAECQEKIRYGASQDEVISYLHSKNVYVMDAFHIVSELYNISMTEAQDVFAAHPDWAKTVENGYRAGQEFIELLAEELKDEPGVTVTYE